MSSERCHGRAAAPTLFRLSALLSVIVLLGSAAGCGTSSAPRVKKKANYGVGYVQRGVASWYGPGFHGNQTANGERYDMYAYTAAHRTLPMGSVVEVRSLTGPRQVTVRINDRGPFVKGRIIDLSRRAAEDLGMTLKGTDKVEIRVIGYQKHAGGVGFLRVQVGSFSTLSNAQAFKRELQSRYKPVDVIPVKLSEGTHYRVLVGQFLSEERADALADKLAAEFSIETLVIRDDT